VPVAKVANIFPVHVKKNLEISEGGNIKD